MAKVNCLPVDDDVHGFGRSTFVYLLVLALLAMIGHIGGLMSLLALTFEDLQSALQGAGLSAAHAQDIFRLVYKGTVEREELSQAVQDFVDEQGGFSLPSIADTTVSGDGWTTKYLLEQCDGTQVESVLMGFPGRHTACLSSQVGCAMGCVFCATGQMGFKRNLTVAEIVAQVVVLNRELAKRGQEPLRNIVMMGMGEPLHNFEAVRQALEIITDNRAIGVGQRRVTISTVGHIPGIKKLADTDANYELSISLHGASDEERSQLIPVNKRWPLQDLLAACEYHAEKRGRSVLVAWTLIAGANDSDDHAHRLAALLKGRPVHLNLIPLNPTEGFDGRPPDQERIERFHHIVRTEAEIPVTTRQRRGIDVGAGCGQLATKK